MQDNLKKAFMRGVCALNYEAMSIVSPDDKNAQMAAMEQEMMRQMNQDDTLTQVSYQLSESDTSQSRFQQL